MEVRRRMRPGVTSKEARDGVALGSSIAAGPVGATGPSNRTVPSDALAVKTTRAGVWRTRSPGTRAAGSHTKVTRVLPLGPRDTPNHGRISVLTCGAGSGGVVFFGSFAFAISAARSASSGDSVQ